jgi:hypothetical protein
LTGSHLIKQISISMRNIVGITTFRSFSSCWKSSTSSSGQTRQIRRSRSWRPSSRRRCSRIGLVWPCVRPVWPVGTGLTGEEHQSNPCATTQFGDFEVEETHRDRKSCVEAKKVCGRWASVRWSDDKDFQIRSWGACIPNYLVRVF